METLEMLTAATVKGDRNEAVAKTQEAINAGIDPEKTLDAMTTAMDIIGEGFKKNEVFLLIFF